MEYESVDSEETIGCTTSWMDPRGIILSKKQPVSKGHEVYDFSIDYLQNDKIIEIENRLVGFRDRTVGRGVTIKRYQ